MALFWQTPTSQPAPPRVPLSPLALALLLRLRAAEADPQAEVDASVDLPRAKAA